MNKKDIEKLFDEKFLESFWDITCVSPIATIPEIKQFIFNTIIPEVLKSIIPQYYEDCKWCSELNQKVKELYWINL